MSLNEHLPVLQLRLLFDAVIASGRCCITLILRDFIGQLEDRILFMKEHEVVILHFDLCHLLRYAIVFI
jgi:hypothetical protein